MKKILNSVILFLLAFVLACCNSSLYQIYRTQSNLQSSPNNKFYVYDNEDVQLIYTFWGDGGPFNFLIRNKSDKPIYIDWKKSSFIWGQSALKYWEDEVVTTVTSRSNYNTLGSTTGRATALSSGNIINIFGGSESFRSTFGFSVTDIVKTKKERITFVPPGVTLYNDDYLINTNFMATNPSDRKLITGKDNKEYSEITYTQETSPINFRNYITYSKTEDFKTEFYIDNRFWVDKIYIISISHAAKFGYNSTTRDISNEVNYYLPGMAAGTNFYKMGNSKSYYWGTGDPYKFD